MTVPFSRRTEWDLAETDAAQLVHSLRAGGKRLVDLTESNPTRVGLHEPAAIARLVGGDGAERYDPHALGLASAREALAASERARGRPLDASRLVLSASTSEAYAWLFKLLCDPADEILVPAPSYPLFSYLADVEAVTTRTYPLVREEGFRVDFGALERGIGDRTRAIVVVNPNNPTGTFCCEDDAAALDAIAARHGLALLVDEVFGDFSWAPLARGRAATLAGDHSALTFVMSGLSKGACAPQLKLGWTAVFGPAEMVTRAMERLEVIADTFLSVSTPAQVALPAILSRRGAVVEEVLARVSVNLAALDGAIAALGADSPVRRLPADGGWCVILEVPRTRSDDGWVEVLAIEDGILVHPGYFFGLSPGSLVVSLLPVADVFAEAIVALVTRASRA